MNICIVVPEVLGLARWNGEVARWPGWIRGNFQILEKL